MKRQVPTCARLHALGMLARLRRQAPADVPWAACGGYPGWVEARYLDGYREFGVFVLPDQVRPK